MCELSAGSIRVDGIDVWRVPLQRLRSRMAIIPQEPTLYVGSVRFNLDPFGERSDMQLWQALDLVNMSATVRALPGGLGYPDPLGVVDNASGLLLGGALSTGQMQLLCVARALLMQAPILVIDEGTSAIDSETVSP